MPGACAMAEGDTSHRDGLENQEWHGTLNPSVSVQTEHWRQDAQTVTDGDVDRVLRELLNHRDRLKDSYQEVLDKQTQAEKQLQVQIKQLKQKRDEEINRHRDTVKAIQDGNVKKEETKKKMEKEKKEQAQKEQDLNSDLEKTQTKSDRLKQERNEMEKKIQSLLEEQTHEKEEWDLELASLRKLEEEVTQGVKEENDRAVAAEVLALESRRDLLIITLEGGESEAEVTLSLLRVATPSLEWIQLKQKWEARLVGIQQMKANLWDQFASHIQEVKNGAKLSSLPSISAPSLPHPPCDPNLLLQRIALAPQLPAQQPAILRDLFHLQPQLPKALACQTSPPLVQIPGQLGVISRLPKAASAFPSSLGNDHPAPPAPDKLGELLEKLHVRFPQCTKSQLTGIMQQIKVTRGTLSGLTVEELCQHVAARLKEADVGVGMLLSAGGPTPPYRAPQGIPAFMPPAQMAFTGLPQQLPTPFKLCLICQERVLPLDLKPMSCNHILHKQCVPFWSLANQKASCPFCPTRR
uniref:Ring finger protein 214 n=1 Tax=Leptobrachium leishanense TaxID=445787 RepID=A0A8C5WIY7_9ANUR